MSRPSPSGNYRLRRRADLDERLGGANLCEEGTVVRVSTRNSPVRVPRRRGEPGRHAFGRFCLVLFVTVVAALLVYASRPAATRLEYSAPRTADGRYIAVRFGASDDTKRRAAYMARKYRLPLISEPGVDEVEIRSFSR